MLVSMAQIMNKARAQGYGVTAPNVQSEDTVRAVIEVAETLKAPMIIDVNHHVHKDFVYFGKMICELVQRSEMPFALNLDHGRTFDEILWAIRAGFTSVMVDRSTLPYEENVAETREVVKMCRPLGISVEAELGHVGRGHSYEVDGVSHLTEPEEAVRFIEQTGVDCLAVAVGTAHGEYKGTPHIDFERLAQIVQACGDTPLVLHGGSGTGDENLGRAVRSGVQKVNLATDLFKAAKNSLLAGLEKDPNMWMYDLMPTYLDGYKKKLAHYVNLFGQDHKA